MTASPIRSLVVLPQPPNPEGGAADRCSVGLIAGLRCHGIVVDVVAVRQHFSVHLPTAGPPPRGVETPDATVVEVPPPSPFRARWTSLTRPVSELKGTAFSDLVAERASRADVVHLEQVETARLDTAGRPTALHLHYRATLDRAFGAPWRKQFRQIVEFHRAERNGARHHRWLLVNSDRVADSIRRLGGDAEIVVAPLTLPPDGYGLAGLDGPPTAGLIGHASWAPTAEAMERLAERVWPMVRKQAPGGRLVIAGRGTRSLAISGADIEVAGEVPSAAGFLGGLSVLAYPITRGSGMKVKVLEAMAMGLPVVTTPAGAEGIATNDGVLVAADDETLARHVSRLLSDADERRERGAAARGAFLARYAPEPATAPVADLYRRMLESAVTTGVGGRTRR